MRKLVSLFAPFAFVLVASGPAFAQQQPPKGTEGPDVRNGEKKQIPSATLRRTLRWPRENAWYLFALSTRWGGGGGPSWGYALLGPPFRVQLAPRRALPGIY